MATEVKQPSRSEREAKIKDKAGWIITVLAALLAINTLYGGQNSSRILNNTIAANNQWAWYQAKNTRETLYEIAALNATKPDVAKKISEEAKRMESDKKEIADRAKALEVQRAEAQKRSPWFTWGGSTLQIAIVLLTASILAVSVPMLWSSIAVGAVGAFFVSQAMYLWLPI